MTAPMIAKQSQYIQVETLIADIFKPIKLAYENGADKIANMLLIEMINALKTQNNEITVIREKMYIDKDLAIPLNTDEFYDTMEVLEDVLKNLLNDTKEFKDKSEVFAKLYNIVDELYTNSLQFAYQVPQMIRELKEEEKIAS